MAANALYFNTISSTTPAPADYFRLVTNSGGIYRNTLTMDLVFRYFNNNTQFNLTNKYMTIFNIGDSASGFQVCLTRRTLDTNPIEIGLRYYMGTGSWAELSGSFISLNSIGDPSVDGFLIMFQYTGTNTSFSTGNVRFYVTQFNNSTTKTAPDFSWVSTSAITNNFTSGEEWGFGSSPESITNTTGYLNTNGYNSYVSQNIYLIFLRTWSILIPVSSSVATTYGLFNTASSNFSLYELDKAQTLAPSNTSDLEFQLQIVNTSLSSLTNFAKGNPQIVTLVTSYANVPNLSSGNFALNSATSYTIVTTNVIPCICRDSKILTKEGYKLVQDISYNDILITHDNRETIVKGLRLDVAICNENTCPIIIRKGIYQYLDNSITCDEDLWISQGHPLLIGNEFVLPEKIQQFEKDFGCGIVYYYHIMTENYYADTIIANGVPIETWGGWCQENCHCFQHECEPVYNERGNRILCIDNH